VRGEGKHRKTLNLSHESYSEGLLASPRDLDAGGRGTISTITEVASFLRATLYCF
jgi:hypothetical protein